MERAVEWKKGDARGIGALHQYTWKGALPYRLTFMIRVSSIRPLRSLEGQASGAVEGTGTWCFSRDGNYTIVEYHWHVRTCLWWMNLLSPLARPLFVWNHDVVMLRGAKGMARLLETLVETNGRVFHPGGLKIYPRSCRAS